MSNSPYTKTVRLSDTECRQLLDKLDLSQELASEKVKPESNRRADPRYQYRHSDLHLIVEQSNGVISRLTVSPRNISSGGIAFLHGGFLYAGSRCAIQLSGPKIEPVYVSGEIVSCRHIEGLLHEVGVKFVMPIDPGLYINISKDLIDSNSKQNLLQQ